MTENAISPADQAASTSTAWAVIALLIGFLLSPLGGWLAAIPGVMYGVRAGRASRWRCGWIGLGLSAVAIVVPAALVLYRVAMTR